LNEADISAINHDVMVKFMTFIIEERKLSKVSVDNYRNLLKTIFEFVRKERKHYPNPVIELPGTKRVNDSAAEPIREEDIAVFKEAITKKDPQLWLAICFEYYCFLRPRKEIRLLRIGDIDFGRGRIKVRFVNAKTEERFVNIPNTFLNLMRNSYDLHNYSRDFYVFSKNGLPGTSKLSINNMTSRFVKFRKDLNMPVMYKLYSWKHTGNIRAEEAGISMRELQVQNGHISVQTTEIYMKNKKGTSSPNIVTKFPEL
jgi:integrase